MKEVDNLFVQYTQPGSPGCAVAVMRDGEIIYRQGYGLANVEHNVPITSATRFNIGSESKQFTAFAILLLANENRLSLDDDMRQHAPELHDFGEVVTIRHLLHHTGGVRCSFPPLLMLAGWREPDVTTSDDVYRLMKAQRGLNFTPGAEHLYSNMGYVILAKIVERASQKPFAQFCAERIFEPLGMANTVVNDRYNMLIANRAQSYYEDGGKVWAALLADSVVGPTNVYTTVEDLARWDENFYTGQVGGMALIEQMHRRGVLNNGTEISYACGLMHSEYKGLKMIEHGGNQGGYCAGMFRFPEAHFSVILLTNIFIWGTRDIALRVAELYLGDRLKEPTKSPRPITPVVLSQEQLEDKAGKYFHAGRGAFREITLSDGALRLFGRRLLPVNDNAFVLEDDPSVRLTFTQGTMQIASSVSDYTYKRVEAAALNAGELEEYAGRYYSPELDVHWTIVLEGGRLAVKRHKYNDSYLTPLFTDGFNDDWSSIVGYPVNYFIMFERDGGVTGFAVSEDRMRRVRFVRER